MASTTISNAHARLRDRRSRETQDSSPRVPSEARVPTIEGYELLERVGSGGMGLVYAATAVTSGRRVAAPIRCTRRSRSR